MGVNYTGKGKYFLFKLNGSIGGFEKIEPTVLLGMLLISSQLHDVSFECWARVTMHFKVNSEEIWVRKHSA